MANKAISTLAVGSIIQLKENGKLVSFYVAKHNYENSLNGMGRTLVVRKDCYDTRQWHSSNVNAYASSAIDSWLNSTYKNLLDADIRGAIGTTKIKHTPGNGNNTVGTLERAIFQLSATELNKSASWLNVEGTALEIASSLQIAYMNGSAVTQWTRSPDKNNTTDAVYLYINGGVGYGSCSQALGARPAFTLPSTALVDDSGNVVIPDLTAHKTLVNGTAYDVKGGKCMVGGTVYNILKGRTLIDGTGYDITLPSAWTKLSALDVGQSVFTNVGGVKKEFLVVHQGLPSSLYDSSCDGTWLLMKDIYENRQWLSWDDNNLENSAIHSYLNNTFLNLFDSNIRDAIKQVKIPYRKKGGSGGTDQSGANGLSAKIFFLSGLEVGLTTSDSWYFPQDGAKLSYFESGTGTSANNKRIAKQNGKAGIWWLRSPNAQYTDYVWVVISNGYYSYSVASNPQGVRPAFILRSDALVDDEFNIIS